ncbi:hypothetical protein EIZ39_19020 [Ammoniphilus sp. CFH 90114]|nr:phenylalanine--tRNA ligase beta subunit-related protein [Ammoniphilus sp. CFH 90114]RXT04957.1 hypothetical protein EIZ39_19020 [Ammoniphilus sp. CFH 90114]
MNLIIDKQISELLPGFRLGFIEYNHVVVSETPKMAKGRINLFLSTLRLDHSGNEGLTKIDGVKQWRQAFKALGMDPSRYRPSSEALLKRVLQEKPMYWVNGAVDVNNFLSMKFGLPFGIYNKDKINGDRILCELGKSGYSYEGLNGRETSMEGKLVLTDDFSPFGSPIVDSTRTSIDETATRLIQVIFIHPQLNEEQHANLLESSAQLFTQINGGEVVSSGIVE